MCMMQPNSSLRKNYYGMNTVLLKQYVRRFCVYENSIKKYFLYKNKSEYNIYESAYRNMFLPT